LEQRVKDTLNRPCPFCGKPLYINRVFMKDGKWRFDDVYCDCRNFKRANRIAWKFYKELNRAEKKLDKLANKMKKLDDIATGDYNLLGTRVGLSEFPIMLVDSDDIKRKCYWYDSNRISK